MKPRMDTNKHELLLKESLVSISVHSWFKISELEYWHKIGDAL
jgi:hypothetical protein